MHVKINIKSLLYFGVIFPFKFKNQEIMMLNNNNDNSRQGYKDNNGHVKYLLFL